MVFKPYRHFLRIPLSFSSAQFPLVCHQHINTIPHKQKTNGQFRHPENQYDAHRHTASMTAPEKFPSKSCQIPAHGVTHPRQNHCRQTGYQHHHYKKSVDMPRIPHTGRPNAHQRIGAKAEPSQQLQPHPCDTSFSCTSERYSIAASL